LEHHRKRKREREKENKSSSLKKRAKRTLHSVTITGLLRIIYEGKLHLWKENLRKNQSSRTTETVIYTFYNKLTTFYV
jgi:hypothetical protein